MKMPCTERLYRPVLSLLIGIGSPGSASWSCFLIFFNCRCWDLNMGSSECQTGPCLWFPYTYLPVKAVTSGKKFSRINPVV